MAVVKDNLQAHARFESLVEDYVQAMSTRSREERLAAVKKTPDSRICLAQETEVQELIAAFRDRVPDGTAVAEMERLVRAAIFKPANDLVGMLLPQAADRIDANY